MQARNRLTEISLEEFQKLNTFDKAKYFSSGRDIYHVIIAQQFDRDILDHLGNLATCIRRIAKTKEGMLFLHNLLAHKHAMLYFTQPSSRTFLSHAAACHILGIGTEEVRDTSTSSEVKGETREDSIRTFSSYFDMIIMRSEIGGLADQMSWVLSNSERPIPILNAGSGSDQHPTQALLDIYTLQRSFEKRRGIDGKNIVFVGDLARGRTVRSLSYLLTEYEGVKQYFVAPEELQVGDDVQDILKKAGVDYELVTDFNKIIPEADAIYMTRIQDEWDDKKGESADLGSKYIFGLEQLKLLKIDAVIMHPLPRRQELPTDIDRDPRAVYWRQMRNGMWVRAALIATIFQRDQEILNYHNLMS